MKMIKREKDMMLDNSDIEFLYQLENFPIYCGTTESESKSDKLADMKWGISKESGMIQLMDLVPLDELYAVSHNGAIGKVWKEHHTEFAKFVYKNTNAELGILEIGGGNGILNAVYNSMFPKCMWTIVEPSEVQKVENVTAEYVKIFWGDSDTECQITDSCVYGALVHSHLMEHQYDIHKFMKIDSNALEIGQKMIFSIPNMQRYLEMGYMNALGFEHTYFITEAYISILMKQYGFQIIDKQYFGESHSIFYAVEKISNIVQIDSKLFNGLYESNKKLFESFIKKNIEIVRKLNGLIDSYAGGKIYLFGAHIFAQYLIAFGLHTEKIVGVLDNDANKQGKRLYGTEFITYSPQILKDEINPAVVLVMGAYSDEIQNDILENINKDAVIWREEK